MSLLRRRPLLLALAATLTAIASFGLVGGPASVDAQVGESARFTVETAGLDDDTAIVTVALDPGTSRIAALTAGLSFDAEAVTASSCEVSITGVCNVVDGEVKFAGLSVRGFDEVADFLTVTFTATGDASEAVALDLKIVTASDDYGILLDDIELVGTELQLVDMHGSMTGDVVDASTGVGLYDVDVCAAVDAQAASCVRTSGLGSFLIDELASGRYTVVVSDPAGLYEPVSTTVDVESPEITTGIVADMRPSVISEEPAGPVEPAPSEPASAAPTPLRTSPVALAGDASTVTGTVTDAATGDAIFGLQVCATMPMLGTQACAYTTATGEYRIEGLATGNHNITVSDPAKRYADTVTDRFVGVTAETGAAGVDLSVERN